MKIHLRYNGRSQVLEAPNLNDGQLIEYLQQRGHLPGNAAPRRGQALGNSFPPEINLMIDRHPDAVVIRPPAVFG